MIVYAADATVSVFHSTGHSGLFQNPILLLELLRLVQKIVVFPVLFPHFLQILRTTVGEDGGKLRIKHLDNVVGLFLARGFLVAPLKDRSNVGLQCFPDTLLPFVGEAIPLILMDLLGEVLEELVHVGFLRSMSQFVARSR
jgi:hypothetical protein